MGLIYVISIIIIFIVLGLTIMGTKIAYSMMDKVKKQDEEEWNRIMEEKRNEKE